MTKATHLARALYYFPGDQPDDLAFEAGDLIEVYEYGATVANLILQQCYNCSLDDPEWWSGKHRLTGAYGSFPSTLVEVVAINPELSAPVTSASNGAAPAIGIPPHPLAHAHVHDDIDLPSSPVLSDRGDRSIKFGEDRGDVQSDILKLIRDVDLARESNAPVGHKPLPGAPAGTPAYPFPRRPLPNAATGVGSAVVLQDQMMLEGMELSEPTAPSAVDSLRPEDSISMVGVRMPPVPPPRAARMNGVGGVLPPLAEETAGGTMRTTMTQQRPQLQQAEVPASVPITTSTPMRTPQTYAQRVSVDKAYLGTETTVAPSTHHKLPKIPQQSMPENSMYHVPTQMPVPVIPGATNPFDMLNATTIAPLNPFETNPFEGGTAGSTSPYPPPAAAMQVQTPFDSFNTSYDFGSMPIAMSTPRIQPYHPSPTAGPGVYPPPAASTQLHPNQLQRPLSFSSPQSAPLDSGESFGDAYSPHRVSVQGVGAGQWYSNAAVDKLRTDRVGPYSNSQGVYPPSHQPGSFEGEQIWAQGDMPVAEAQRNGSATWTGPPTGIDSTTISDGVPPKLMPLQFLSRCEDMRNTMAATAFNPQAASLQTVDKYMRNIRRPDLSFPEQFALKYVSRKFSTKLERARAIYIWIAENISYDAKARRAKMWSFKSTADPDEEESPASVLKSRKARREGFALLYQSMAIALGLVCNVVRGYLKVPTDDVDSDDIPEVNHAWNVLEIDGEIRFIDVALGCESHPYNNGAKGTQLFYFLARPTHLIYTHFPADIGDQFLSQELPPGVFHALPYARPAYFECDMQPVNVKGTVFLIRDQETIQIVLSVASGVSVSAEVETLTDTDAVIGRMPALSQSVWYNGRRVARIWARMKGRDGLRGYLKIYAGIRSPASLSAKSATKPQSLPLAVIFRTRHTNATESEPIDFFVKHPTQREFYVREPLDGELRFSRTYRFHVRSVRPEDPYEKLVLVAPSSTEVILEYDAGNRDYIADVQVLEIGVWQIAYVDGGTRHPIATYRTLHGKAEWET